MPKTETLLIRADASVATGTGHVMRCLALAQAWQDVGGKAVIAMAEATPAIVERLHREKIEVVRLDVTPGSADDAVQTCALARQWNSEWVTADGYRFGAEYQVAIKSQGLHLLFIDDDGRAQNYSADLVLNQNAHATESLYEKRAGYTKLLLGPRYAVLRREFASWRDWRREIPAAGQRVLVTMGGSDPDNFTQRVIEGLREVRAPRLEGHVVVGGSNPHRRSLEQALLGSPHALHLETNVVDMPALMSRCDMAVACAGTTSLEMCLMGLPAVLVDLAENQTPIARELARRGIAIYPGSARDVTLRQIATDVESLLSSAERRSRMSQLGRALVDGKGAQRVVIELQHA